MIRIKIVTPGKAEVITTDSQGSLLEILRSYGHNIYTPCGGKGKCGKCMVLIRNEGEVLACRYHPSKDIEVILPGEDEANILVHQTDYLANVPFKTSSSNITSHLPVGVAADIGTTTVVLYYLNLLTGQIERISSFMNPQKLFGADVITRINFCQEQENSLQELQKSIINAINRDLGIFAKERDLDPYDFEKVVIVGNTTMLHLLLGEDPISIALAPFKPKFISKQIRRGDTTGLEINPGAEVITLPCISAYVGADILAGLAVLNVKQTNYLFLDIGTNGEIALIRNDEIFTCATAAGPAFEGANISCGMAAVSGAISVFSGPESFQVIGNGEAVGICGSGIVDIVAYMLGAGLIDETGLLKEPFVISPVNKIQIIQQDIREIQLAKSAIYSGVKVLLERAGVSFGDIEALFLAGGFGNYINVRSATLIGLLPYELKDKIYTVGNSAGIGALQYLKNVDFEGITNSVLERVKYIELSYEDEFTTEFAMNMNFSGNIM